MTRVGRMALFLFDTLPEQARLIEGIKPAFAPTEVLNNCERYAKLFDETFGAR